MVGVSTYPRLDPNVLIPEIYYRYALYHLSRIGGRLYRFFMTGWRPLVLWLLVSIVLILALTAVIDLGGGTSLDADAAREATTLPEGGILS